MKISTNWSVLPGLALIGFSLACGAQHSKESADETASSQTVAAESRAFDPAPTAPEMLPNGRTPFEGVLTGGQPTDEQLADLAEAGYRTVINLRSDGEEGNTDPSDVEGLGMTYIAIPIESAETLNEENARLLADTLDNAEGPVVVHCGSGNRVGALFALKAFYVDGSPAEEALAVGQSSGLTRLEPVVREKLGLPAP